MSGVCLPEENLSGAKRDRRDEPLTLPVSWWMRGGLGKETPSPTATRINTLPVYGKPAGTQIWISSFHGVKTVISDSGDGAREGVNEAT